MNYNKISMLFKRFMLNNFLENDKISDKTDENKVKTFLILKNDFFLSFLLKIYYCKIKFIFLFFK